MFLYRYFVFCICLTFGKSSEVEHFDLLSNDLKPQHDQVVIADVADEYLIEDKILTYQDVLQEKVKVQLFYETLCPDCREFDVKSFAPTVKKLWPYLDIYVYPYGNAKTFVNETGEVEIECQHGPPECYGNMLHACTIDHLQNITKAIEFNSCMMDLSQDNHGSDDQAATKCGTLMSIDSEPIKQCAKSSKGFELLKAYGDESKKIGFNFVPYILINGVQNDGNNFFKDVCAVFSNPPPSCNCY